MTAALDRVTALAEPPLTPLESSPAPLRKQSYRPPNGFLPLSGPAAYDRLFRDAEPSTITVVKFVAAGCRACRAATPKLASIAKKWPDARFYSMELTRDAEEIYGFFQARNISHMPFVEVFVGASCVDSIIVTPSRTNFVISALTAARSKRASMTRYAFRRKLVMRMRRNHTRLLALQRLRARLAANWEALPSSAADRMAQRRAHLKSVLQIRDERDELLRERRLLKRRRQLLYRFVYQHHVAGKARALAAAIS